MLSPSRSAVWDIFYYVWLKVFIALAGVARHVGRALPDPGADDRAGCYAPVSVSVLMVLAGVLFLRCENAGRRVHFSGLFWALLAAGFVLIFASFFTNGFSTTGDKTEADLTYWWPLLVLGDACGLGAILVAVRAPRRKQVG